MLPEKYYNSTIATRNLSNTINSYFESKKRDLSDKLNGGDERQKPKESNLDLSLNQDGADVFFWRYWISKIYINICLKKLDKKVNEIHLLSTTTNYPQVKSTQQLKEVNDTTRFINKKFEEFEADRREKEPEITKLKSTINSLNVIRLLKVDKALDRQEECSQRNCLLIHDIDKEKPESTDDFINNILKNEMN